MLFVRNAGQMNSERWPAMKLRTALRSLIILGAAAIIICVLAVITKLMFLIIALPVILIAVLIIIFVYMKCPYCGLNLYTVRDPFWITNRCPYCGGDLELRKNK